ncbi:MAG: hypothetical protein ACREBU_19630 [Nitrososphaera sp.]
MKIKRNKKLEEQLYKRLEALFDRQQEARTGIHVSGLMQPRKAYWQAVDPQPLTRREIGFFTAGRAHHEIILSAMKGKKLEDSPDRNVVTDEGTKEWKGIFYSPDYRLGFLAEIKSNRKQQEPDESNLAEEYDNYLSQLTKYMAVENEGRASLIVFFISMRVDDKNKATEPTLRCYDVVLTPEQLEDIRKEMLKTKKAIERAIETKNHKPLPLCPEWMCYGGGYYGDAFENCKWYNKCKPEGRYPLSLVSNRSKSKKKKGDDDE